MRARLTVCLLPVQLLLPACVMLAAGVARADASLPEPPSCKGEPWVCPLLSEDGKSLVIGEYDHSLKLWHDDTPFSEAKTITDLAPLGRMHPLPPRLFVHAFAWGQEPQAELIKEANGLRFRVHNMVLTVERDGKILVSRKLSRPGLECYEASPYVVEVWFEPKQRLLLYRTWGDKCMTPWFAWVLVRLS